MQPDHTQAAILRLISDGREFYYIRGRIYLQRFPDELQAGCDCRTDLRLSLEDFWAMKKAGWIEAVKATKACAHCHYACFLHGPSFTVPVTWDQLPYCIAPPGQAVLAKLC